MKIVEGSALMIKDKDREILDKIHELAIQLSGSDECEDIILSVNYNSVKVNKQCTHYVKSERFKI